MKVILVSQGGKYSSVGSWDFVLVQSSNLDMSFAKVWQYLVPRLELTDLQENVWKHIIVENASVLH